METDKIRPEVAHSVACMDALASPTHGCWRVIRAELLRLADEDARLLAANRDCVMHYKQMAFDRYEIANRYADAESKLAACDAALQSMQAELAALKARLCSVSIVDRCADCGVPHVAMTQADVGRRVRVLVEDEPTGEHADSVEAWAARHA